MTFAYRPRSQPSAPSPPKCHSSSATVQGRSPRPPHVICVNSAWAGMHESDTSRAPRTMRATPQIRVSAGGAKWRETVARFDSRLMAPPQRNASETPGYIAARNAGISTLKAADPCVPSRSCKYDAARPMRSGQFVQMATAVYKGQRRNPAAPNPIADVCTCDPVLSTPPRS